LNGSAAKPLPASCAAVPAGFSTCSLSFYHIWEKVKGPFLLYMFFFFWHHFDLRCFPYMGQLINERGVKMTSRRIQINGLMYGLMYQTHQAFAGFAVLATPPSMPVVEPV
jgi:hypothetical protein